MDKINLINDLFTILSLVINIFFAFDLSIRLYHYITKKRYIKKVLGFNKNIVQISHSTFSLSLYHEQKHDFITYESIESINNIVELLHIINQKFSLFEKSNSIKNEINIGGFVANVKVNAYFTNQFPDFKYIANINRKNVYMNYPINHNLIEYSDNKTGFKIKNKLFLETNKNIDYAFLLKMTNNDFKDSEEKTTHIIFGGSNLGTIKATEYLLTHYKQIYKKYGKGHYFFAIKINRLDKSIDYSQGIIDLSYLLH